MKKSFNILMVPNVVIAFVVLLTTSQLLAVPVTIISPSKITGAVFSISTPGLYVLSDDVAYSTAAGTAITITTSDVTLDLNGKTIRGSSTASTAIYISPAQENIIVKNGALLNFEGDIVRVTTGSRSLAFEDLAISGTSNNSSTSNGFSFEGTLASATRTYDVFIKNCHVTSARQGLSATGVDNVAVENSSFNKNGIRGFGIVNCNNWSVNNCQMSGNSTTAAATTIGASLSDSAFWSVRNSDFSFNINSTRGSGVVLLGPNRMDGGHLFENCTFCNNGATGASLEADGINFAMTFSCIARDCIANGNFSVTSTAAGFRLDSPGAGNYLENCIANGNRVESTTINAYGFMLDNTHSRVTLSNCIAEANRSQARGAGFFMNSTNTNCSFKDCQALFNTARGFITESTTAFLIGNLSVGHGSHTNNYDGVGTYTYYSVVNPSLLPSGRFDERGVDNISIA